MYLIIKKSDFGKAGISYAVAGHDEDRGKAISKKMALDTLNDDKGCHSFQLWTSSHGFLDIDNTGTTKTNGKDQEAGVNE